MITPTATRRVAIIGNPNTGKSSIFNALTGLSQKVGNYPGVTVEKKTGVLTPGIELIDLPGTYSLAAHSPDEMLAVRVLLGDHEGEPAPDLVVVIADATTLQRNLYLATQVIEIGLPTIIALNMIDVADSRGISVNTRGLSKALGVPVIATIANRRLGVEELREAILGGLDLPAPLPGWTWPEPIAREMKELESKFGTDGFLLRRALIDENGPAEALLASRVGGDMRGALEGARARIREHAPSAAALEAEMRHRWIGEATAPYVQRTAKGRRRTERIDDVLIHRIFGLPIFILVMGAVFISIFAWAAPFMDMIIGFFDGLGTTVVELLAGTPFAGGALESMVVEGMIAGVGGILAFLPQIVFLFLFIAILEDCGYMARAAFLMDRLFRVFRLSGSSFIPLLSSFACAVPGIMATRTIGNARDRMVTVLIAPFMSCSARMPVYSLMIAAFLPARMIAGFLPLQGLIFGAMYFVGIFAAIPAAVLLKRFLVKGPRSTFVMEMPAYKVPNPRSVGIRILERSRTFLRQAGTIIFAMSVVVWALGYFPRPAEIGARFDEERGHAERTMIGAERAEVLHRIHKEEAGAYVRASFLGRAGHFLEPAVVPLGWDWKIGMATVASFPAREIIVSTLNIIYDLGEESGDGDEREALIGKLAAARRENGQPVFTIPVALSIMVFFALCCQCGATLAAIKRETNSWRWTSFTFLYMTVLAYIGALVVYQVGTAMMG
ncbi:MAG: ferrous iron transport protein B [Candidatus Eisenbacteria bacterium]